MKLLIVLVALILLVLLLPGFERASCLNGDLQACVRASKYWGMK